MYYSTIHDLVRNAAAAEGVSIKKIIEDHGIIETSYYRHLRTGTPWKVKDVQALAEITGKSTAEILNNIL